jgi:hypothetical protein
MKMIPLQQLPSDVQTFLEEQPGSEPTMLCDERGAVHFAIIRFTEPKTNYEAWLQYRKEL